MSKISNFKSLIKAVAKECGYKVEGTGASFEIYTEFYIKGTLPFTERLRWQRQSDHGE